MATATIEVTVRDYWDDGKRVHIVGTMDFDTGDYATGGIAPTLTGLFPGQRSTPNIVSLYGKSGYHYEFSRSTGKVLVRQNKNPADTGGADIPLPELAASGLPSAVSSDVIDFYAVCKKFV